MNQLIIHRRIIYLFLIYLLFITVFAAIYWCIYNGDNNSFIIQSQDFQKELLIADSLSNAHGESILVEEERKVNENINKRKDYYRLYNNILNDSSKLVKKYGNAIPQAIVFSNFNAISSRINRYVGWISSKGNQDYIFFPEYEGQKFRYRLIISDYERNSDKHIIDQRINVHSLVENKYDTSAIKQDRFSYLAANRQMDLEEFHNEIIKSRITDITKIIRFEEKKLDSIKIKLEVFRKKKKKPFLRLGGWDFFYFSTNIQTTGDFIDIIPNSTDVRICIAIQRIINVFLLSLVFAYYLVPKDKK